MENISLGGVAEAEDWGGCGEKEGRGEGGERACTLADIWNLENRGRKGIDQCKGGKVYSNAKLYVGRAAMQKIF